MPFGVRVSTYAALSVGALAAACAYAVATRKNYYSVMVFLWSSKLVDLMLNNLALLGVYGASVLVKRAFFGEFRPVEQSQMSDVLATSIVDLLLAMTIFRDEFNARFLSLAVVLLFLQWFHSGLRLRVDYVEQTTQMSRFDLWRLAVLAGLLLVCDVLLVWYALVHVLESGVGAVVLFGFEATLLACAVIQTSLRLVYNVYDMRVGYHWRAKGFFVLWTDFVAECFNVLVYVIFFSVVLVYVGRPLHLIRQMYYTFRRFLDFVHDISLWRRATANFDERYANVTQAELLEQGSDDVCMICREQVDVGKRLPCGHVLHAECLQDWLRRKQICPTCRVSVLREEIRDPSKLWRPPRERAAARAAATAAAAAAAAGPAAAPAAAPARRRRNDDDVDDDEDADGDEVDNHDDNDAGAAADDAAANQDDNDDDEAVAAGDDDDAPHNDDDDDDDDGDARRAAPAPAPVERAPRLSRRKKEKNYRRAVSLLLEAASDAALNTADARRQAMVRAQRAIRLLDDASDSAERAVNNDQWREVSAVMDQSKIRVDELAHSVRRMQSELAKEHARLARLITGQEPADKKKAKSKSKTAAAAAAAAPEDDESALLAMAMMASLEDAPRPKQRAPEPPASNKSKFTLPAALTTPPATPQSASQSSRAPLTMSTPGESLSTSLDALDTSTPLSASVSSMSTPSEREELRQKRLARLGSLQLSSGSATAAAAESSSKPAEQKQD